MPKYAHDLPGVPTGWYNTDRNPNIKLPTEGVLTELTEDQWNNRIDDKHLSGFVKIPVPNPERDQANRKLEANALLIESNSIILEYFEDSVPPPTELVAYRKTLRAIVNGDTTTPLPKYVKAN